ncbi:MAG: hypothetical protein ACXWQE_09535 [Bdellovibrionales bacterium]
MRLKLIGLVMIATLISACKVEKAEYKAPDFKMPEIKLPIGKDLQIPDFFVCNKIDNNVSEDLKKNAIQVHGTTDLQDTESVCDGKKTLAPKMAQQNFRADLDINPPESLKSKVSFAIVENTRTCVSRRLTVQPVSTESPEAQKALWPANPYKLDEKGLIKIGLNDSTFRMQFGLNVSKGQNLISIIYYGRCLEKPSDPGVCNKGEELARQTILVNADIEVRELNGIKTYAGCIKPTK